MEWLFPNVSFQKLQLQPINCIMYHTVCHTATLSFTLLVARRLYEMSNTEKAQKQTGYTAAASQRILLSLSVRITTLWGISSIGLCFMWYSCDIALHPLKYRSRFKGLKVISAIPSQERDGSCRERTTGSFGKCAETQAYALQDSLRCCEGIQATRGLRRPGRCCSWRWPTECTSRNNAGCRCSDTPVGT